MHLFLANRKISNENEIDTVETVPNRKDEQPNQKMSRKDRRIQVLDSEVEVLLKRERNKEAKLVELQTNIDETKDVISRKEREIQQLDQDLANVKQGM